MRTLLTFRKFDPEGNPLGKPLYQWSKSWTLGLMQNFYLMHAQIPNATSYPSMKDNWGGNRSGDVETMATDYNSSREAYWRSMLQVAGPAGDGAMMTSGPLGSSYVGVGDYSRLPGAQIGILIGSGNAPATPTDYALSQMICHGKGGSAASGIQDQYTGSDTEGTRDIYSGTNGDIYWKPVRSMIVTAITIKAYRIGTPGNITLSLRGSNYPKGGYADLGAVTVAAGGWATTPGDWYTFTLGAPVRVWSNFWYWIHITGTGTDGSNCIRLRGTNYSSVSVPLPSYRMWLYYYRSSNLYSPGLVKITGACEPEIEYGATEIDNLVISNPNASFDIKRHFVNRSGENITVQECGINALSGNKNSTSYTTLIARDVIAPAITVANGETLLVTYTPQITV